MVRLKGNLSTLDVSSFTYFNSNMVRLKASLGTNEAPSASGFQFQYGAIKGDVSIKFVSTTKPFQFQYGAIKGERYGESHTVCKYFNSNMVRLKDGFSLPDMIAFLAISIPIWCD